MKHPNEEQVERLNVILNETMDPSWGGFHRLPEEDNTVEFAIDDSAIAWKNVVEFVRRMAVIIEEISSEEK